MKKVIHIWVFMGILLIVSCNNPFAPKISDIIDDSSLISDQRTIEGVFQNFKYAYQNKDTLVYGGLLAPDFVFVFRDYDKGVDVTWARDDDMLSTYKLFNATQNMDLVWSNVLVPTGDSLNTEVSRGFSLTIVFSASDIVKIQGRANFTLRRAKVEDPWMIYIWRDESNY
jgi:hypothetical protein